MEYLGSGVDGIATKIKVDGFEEPLVLKLVSSYHDVYIIHRATKREQFFHREKPGDDPYHTSYFPFKRECVNAALLELITTSSRRATASGRPIYVNPDPKTRSEAIQNLRAFSTDDVNYGTTILETKTELVREFPGNEDDSIAIKNINGCLGWVEVDLSDAMKMLGPLPFDLKGQLPQNKAFGLVYRFVPDQGPIDKKYILRQTNLFHITGFHILDFKGNNWRGEGVLVDFSDIVAPWESAWQDLDYAGYSVGYEASLDWIVRKVSSGQTAWDQLLRVVGDIKRLGS